MTMAAKMMEASTYDGPFVKILRRNPAQDSCAENRVFCAGILRLGREELPVLYPLRLKSSGFSIFNSAILKLVVDFLWKEG